MTHFSSPSSPGSRLSRWRIIGWLVFVALIFGWWFAQQPRVRTVPYSAFREAVRAGRVQRVMIEGEEISGTMAAVGREGEDSESSARESSAPGAAGSFVTYVPSVGDDELIGLLESHDVTVATRPAPRGSGWGLLLTLAPLLLLLGIGALVLRNMGNQGRSLLRAGRFDRRITVDLPSLKDREEILEIHARDKPLDEKVDLGELARGTPGLSGADLENLLNEAALLAARERSQIIAPEHVGSARDKLLMGLAREALDLSEEECRTLACHESGHAVVAALLPYTDPLYKVSIVPRGPAMGATITQPRRDRHVHSRAQLLDQLAVMMGGRAAERLLLETETSGAADDLARSTELARQMVIELGMSERLGHLAYTESQQNVFLGGEITRDRRFSEETAREIDEEVRELLQLAFHRAAGVLQANRAAVEHIAGELRAHEELTGEQVAAMLEERVAIKGRSAHADAPPAAVAHRSWALANPRDPRVSRGCAQSHAGRQM